MWLNLAWQVCFWLDHLLGGGNFGTIWYAKMASNGKITTFVSFATKSNICSSSHVHIWYFQWQIVSTLNPWNKQSTPNPIGFHEFYWQQVAKHYQILLWQIVKQVCKKLFWNQLFHIHHLLKKSMACVNIANCNFPYFPWKCVQYIWAM